MADDLLSGATWECTATTPGELESLSALNAPGRTGWPAKVPGTAAAALAGLGGADVVGRDYDGEDWWFRCRFTGPSDAGPWRLVFDGVATLADVYLNGEPVAHHENMFRRFSAAVSPVAGENELVVKCGSLSARLGARRPRPRWKTPLVNHQNLRWIRTTLLGRVPGLAESPEPVGIWRPVRLDRVDPTQPDDRVLTTRCDGTSGVIETILRFAPGARPHTAHLEVAGVRAALSIDLQGDKSVASGSVHLASVQRWWPRSHGAQPLYEVTAEVDGKRFVLGRVGFRTLEVDRSDGGFQVLVNGVETFCRGAAWMPPDPIGFCEDDADLDDRLALACEANVNMLRIPGITTYASRRFLDRCDELGIMVWHDAMFAFVDPPDDADWTEEAVAEVAEACEALSGHPAVAVFCGNQEVEEVGAMQGLPEDDRRTPFFEKTLATVVAQHLPGVTYVSSNPTGGSLPFRMDEGVSQYFGVGGYMRPLDDVRRAGVRFAAECLVLASPPDRRTVDEACGGATRAGHDPAWKRAIHHDAGRSWDMDDVRDFYVHELFGVDPLALRYVDPERMLDLGRATNAELVSRVFSEWRRPSSTCAGGLVMAFGDLAPGAGWGLVDVFGRPKSTWYALRRVWAPLTLLISDESLNGLRLHVVNDHETTRSIMVSTDLYADGEHHVDHGERHLEVPGRGAATLDAEALLGGFRDVSYAFRFGPPAHDLVVARIVDDAGAVLAEATHLIGGEARAIEPDVGLIATVSEGSRPGEWPITVGTQRFAQWVSVEVDHGRPDDSWFHLAPGSSRVVTVSGTEERPTGSVRALNSRRPAPLRVAEQNP